MRWIPLLDILFCRTPLPPLCTTPPLSPPCTLRCCAQSRGSPIRKKVVRWQAKSGCKSLHDNLLYVFCRRASKGGARLRRLDAALILLGSEGFVQRPTRWVVAGALVDCYHGLATRVALLPLPWRHPSASHPRWTSRACRVVADRSWHRARAPPIPA